MERKFKHGTIRVWHNGSQVVDIIDDSKAPAAGEIEVADSKGETK